MRDRRIAEKMMICLYVERLQLDVLSLSFPAEVLIHWFFEILIVRDRNLLKPTK